MLRFETRDFLKTILLTTGIHAKINLRNGEVTKGAISTNVQWASLWAHLMEILESSPRSRKQLALRRDR